MRKYDYNFPKAPSSQKMNDYIKDACQIAELDRLIEVKTFKKGKPLMKEFPLYTQVSNHTARYTFINIMLNDFDVPPVELRKVTGQSLNVLMGYERGDKQKNAIKVHAKVIEAMQNRRLTVVK